MTKPDDLPSPGSVVDDYLRERSSNAGPVELRNFLTRHPDLPLHDQRELLLIDQHVGWRLGCGTPSEEYLREFPTILSDSQSVTDLLYGEWRASGKLGVPSVSDSLAAQFPDLAERLAHQVELLNWLCDEAVDWH